MHDKQASSSLTNNQIEDTFKTLQELIERELPAGTDRARASLTLKVYSSLPLLLRFVHTVVIVLRGQ